MCLRSYFHLPKIVLESHFTLVFLFEVISTPHPAILVVGTPLNFAQKMAKIPGQIFEPSICIMMIRILIDIPANDGISTELNWLK